MTPISVGTNPCSVVPIALIMWLSLQTGRTQSGIQSPRELIEFLTHQAPPEAARPILSDCGSVRIDRAAARALAESGRGAIPALDDAIRSIDSRTIVPGELTGAGWLLAAYAKIEGANAYLRLRELERNPNLLLIRYDIDDALALSLSLTSYVSSSNLLTVVFDCARNGEPRQTLNQLILAWERNDRGWLEKSLGPNAKASLNTLLEEKSWAAMRAELWKRESKLGDAVGYRFAGGGKWAESPETLLERHETTDGLQDFSNPELDTRFTDSSGRECGRHSMKFITPQIGAPPSSLRYLIDNSDLSELLHTVASCAVAGN